MAQKESTSRFIVNFDWFDFIGETGTPVIHLGGVATTGELLEMCQIADSSQVLDVGCGTGYTACGIAARYNAQVVGIDLSETMIESARKRARELGLEGTVEFRVADVFQLPFDDESFDVVISESVLAVLPGDKPRAIGEIVRVLRPGGRVGANEGFAHPSTPAELLERVTALMTYGEPPPTSQEWRELFEDSGLDVLHTIEKSAREEVSLRSMLSAIKTTGLRRILSMLWRTAREANLRQASKAMNEGKRIMFRQKSTRDFFGYALIVGQKPGEVG